jgi:hypothetical protein
MSAPPGEPSKPSKPFLEGYLKAARKVGKENNRGLKKKFNFKKEI